MPPDLPWLLSALGFAAAMSATPGPNNAMLASSGATFGLARTLPHILGIVLGFPVMLLALALGAGDLFRAVPTIQLVLKWAGAAYLLWLAWHIATADPVAAGLFARARPLGFLQAALFQWVNPKAWIIAIGAIAAYTDGPAKAAILAAIFILVALPATAFWTLTGVGAARLLRGQRGLRAFNWTMAALLILSLIPVLLEA